jgi:hypothetical protein
MAMLRQWICALMMTAAVSAAAQQISGSIRGTVTDASGALVQSAAVTARHVETGLTRTAFQKLTPDPDVQVFGNEGRNAVQGPGYANWDFAAVKN